MGDVKKFIDAVGAEVSAFIKKYADKPTEAIIAKAATAAAAYNQLCEFAESYDGSGDESGADGKDEIYGELMGAEKYMKRWKESGDAQYQSMAKDELKHAGILMDKQPPADAATKKQYETLQSQLMTRLNSPATAM